MAKNEQKQAFPYEIYCDMDGVLVDLFENGVFLEAKDPNLRKNLEKIIEMRWRWSKDHENPEIQAALEWIRQLLGDNRSFWANLRPLPGVFAFWRYLASFGS